MVQLRATKKHSIVMLIRDNAVTVVKILGCSLKLHLMQGLLLFSGQRSGQGIFFKSLGKYILVSVFSYTIEQFKFI